MRRADLGDRISGADEQPGFLLEANPTITIGQTVGAGHFHQLEVPEQMNPMIERFLSVMR